MVGNQASWPAASDTKYPDYPTKDTTTHCNSYRVCPFGTGTRVTLLGCKNPAIFADAKATTAKTDDLSGIVPTTGTKTTPVVGNCWSIAGTGSCDETSSWGYDAETSFCEKRVYDDAEAMKDGGHSFGDHYTDYDSGGCEFQVETPSRIPALPNTTATRADATAWKNARGIEFSLKANSLIATVVPTGIQASLFKDLGPAMTVEGPGICSIAPLHHPTLESCKKSGAVVVTISAVSMTGTVAKNDAVATLTLTAAIGATFATGTQVQEAYLAHGTLASSCATGDTSITVNVTQGAFLDPKTTSGSHLVSVGGGIWTPVIPKGTTILKKEGGGGAGHNHLDQSCNSNRQISSSI